MKISMIKYHLGSTYHPCPTLLSFIKRTFFSKNKVISEPTD